MNRDDGVECGIAQYAVIKVKNDGPALAPLYVLCMEVEVEGMNRPVVDEPSHNLLGRIQDFSKGFDIRVPSSVLITILRAAEAAVLDGELRTAAPTSPRERARWRSVARGHEGFRSSVSH